MKKLKTVLVFLGVIAVVGAFFFILPGTKKNMANIEDKSEEKILIPVTTIPASAGSIQGYIRLSGEVRASSSIDVTPDATGKLATVEVKAGEYVKKNQVLGTVDPSRPGASFSNSPVRTPVSGYVIQIYGEKGGLAAAGRPLFQVGQLDDLEVKAFVSERHALKVKQGQTAVLNAQALGDKTVRAIVTEVSPVIDSRTRSMEITIKADDRKLDLKAGMLVDITLITEEHKNAIRIPTDSIIKRDSKSYVYTINSSNSAENETSAAFTEIETGLEVNGFSQVTKGIKAGDLVVYSGQTMLSDGDSIKIVSELDALPAEGNIRSSK